MNQGLLGRFGMGEEVLIMSVSPFLGARSTLELRMLGLWPPLFSLVMI
jgi:hypothetical protein